jgi:hypothetical protein
MASRSKRPKQKFFATEADLCAAFIAALPKDWTAYAETAGWDILLVRSDGFQIGVQAKLKMNAHVLAQALEAYSPWAREQRGPDCRAIMIPWGEDSVGIGYLATYIGITVIRVAKPEATPHWRSRQAFTPALPEPPGAMQYPWHEQCTLKRCELPSYVPDVAAGARSPSTLSEWKIKAIKICLLMQRQGYVTRDDFRAIKMDHRRWLPSAAGWVKIVNGRYERGTNWPRFLEMHPVAAKKIEADYEQWKPKPPKGVPAEQRAML